MSPMTHEDGGGLVVDAEVKRAVKFAIDAPYPGLDKVDQDIYA